MSHFIHKIIYTGILLRHRAHCILCTWRSHYMPTFTVMFIKHNNAVLNFLQPPSLTEHAG